MTKVAILPGIILSISLASIFPALAHSGRTNGLGCHTNRSTGTYHCHNTGANTNTPSIPKSSLPVVVSVGDGDTFRAKDGANIITVRLACVDAPEMAQKPWGERSKNRLKQILPVGKSVQIKTTDTDRYGRKVAEVRLTNGGFVQQVLAREGLAMVYNQYISSCPSASIVQQAEAQAKQRKAGVWSDSKFVAPWNYRRSK
jgi:micrococcal nuclease